jgi:DNA-binding transcriptional MerR regulator
MSTHSNPTIAEVAREAGVSAATLRAWEERHGVPAPLRLPGGQRRYGEDELARIRRVLAERTAGATLAGAIARTAADDAASGSRRFEFAYTLGFDPAFVISLTNRMVGYVDR